MPPRPVRTPHRLAVAVGIVAMALGVLVILPSACSAADVQVPLDRDGRIQRLDAKLARRLGVFREIAGFDEARLFQIQDSSFVLEITALEGGRVERDRRPLAAAEVDSLRAVVSAAIARSAPEAGLDQSGRPVLMLGSGLLGLGFWGWAIPVAADFDDARAGVSTYFLLSAASFVVPFMVTREAPVTWGATDLALYGGSRGIAHGLLLAQAVGVLDDHTEQALGVATAFSVAELVGGYAWARSTGMNAGRSCSISTFGDFGAAWAAVIADVTSGSGDHDARVCGAALVGSGAGLIAGDVLGRHRDYTYGDAGMMRTAGFVGGWMGGALASAADAEDHVVEGAAMGGSLAGVVIGDLAVRNTDFSTGQLVVVDLASVAGALLGVGVGFAANTDDDTATLVGSAIGAGLGYWAGYASLAKGARADGVSWRVTPGPGLLPRSHRPHDGVRASWLVLQGRF